MAAACNAPSPCRAPSCEFTDVEPPPGPICPPPDPADLVSSPSIPIGPIHATSLDGFNVDGMNNAPRGGAGGGTGRTIAGCNQDDLPFGIDAEFGRVADMLVGQIEIRGPFELRDSVVGDVAATEFRILDLMEPDQADAGCVDVALRFGVLDDRTIVSRTALYAHVSHVYFSAPFELVLHPMPASSSCDGPCVDDRIHIRLAYPTATLRLDATNSQIIDGSVLGGVIFYADDTDVDPSRNAAGLRSEIERYAAAAHLTVVARDALLAAFTSHLDVRVTPDGFVSPCTTPDGVAVHVNPNAISVAFSLE